MPLPNTFAALVTASMVSLDQNFNALGALTPIPCAVAGANAITLTPTPTTATPAVLSYQNYMPFTGVVGAPNSTSVTFQVGSLPALNGYIDTNAGPRQLAANDLVQNNLFAAIYDSALGSGAGGFHVWTAPFPANGGTITGNVTITGNIVLQTSLFAPASTSSVAFGGGASFSSISINGAPYIHRIPSSQVSVTFGVIAANSDVRATVALVGARFLDPVIIGQPSTSSTGVMYDGFVAAADLVVMRAVNATAGTIVLAGAMYRLSAFGWT